MSVQGDAEGGARPSNIVTPKEEGTIQARLKFSPENLKQCFLKEFGSARVVLINVTYFEGGQIAGTVVNP